MAGVCITTVLQQNVSSEPAPVLLTRRLLAPHVPSLPWRPRRRSAVDNVRTFLLPHPHASIVLFPPLMNLANSSVEQTVGIVEDPYWRSGGSVLNLTMWPAVWVELSAPKIIPQIMTTIMMKSGT